MALSFLKDASRLFRWLVNIDGQPGFSSPELASFAGTTQQGGSLYVGGGGVVLNPADTAPVGGEGAIENMNKVLASGQHGVVIWSQDWHPADHISFFTNHPGALKYMSEDKDYLAAAKAATDKGELPPLPIMYFDDSGNILGIIEFGADGVHLKRVKLDKDQPGFVLPEGKDAATYKGRIVEVASEHEILENFKPGNMQVLWTPHCIQGTESARIDPRLDGLPQELRAQLEDQSQNDRTIFVHYDAETDTRHVVVRKGIDSERDSYSFAFDNLQGLANAQAAATDIVQFITLATDELARQLTRTGVELESAAPDTTAHTLPKDVADFAIDLATDLATEVHRAIRSGKDSPGIEADFEGIATDYCVKFSQNDARNVLSQAFEKFGISFGTNLIVDATRGVNVPPGNIEGSLKEMKGNGKVMNTAQVCAGASKHL